MSGAEGGADRNDERIGASPTAGSACRHRPFEIDVETHVFSAEELRRLRTFGGWLRALSSGALAPETEKQRRFVQAVRTDQASTDWERLWLKYVARRELEELRRNTPRHHVTDAAEDWFPRDAWRRGVHFSRRAVQ